MVKTRGGLSPKNRRGGGSPKNQRGGGTSTKRKVLRSSANNDLLEHNRGADQDNNGLKKKKVTFEVGSPSNCLKRAAGNPCESAIIPLKKQKITRNNQNTKAVAEASDVPSMQLFKSRCRPKQLVDLISNFSPEQKQSVHEIGFGALLSLKLKRNPTNMLNWIVDCFDCGSCMFTIDSKKEFIVSEYDVYDVFCLPLNPSNDVKEISRSANKTNPDFALKRHWRLHFGFSGDNDQIPLNLLEAKIPTLVDGGDEFKQLFVMHAISTFLAPTSNRTVDLRIVKSLVNVGEIKTMNWCKYVLDKLCEGLRNYKKGENEFCCGCVLMLEIIYFHRLKFRNVELSTSLPLIQHWSDESIRDRIKKEKMSKSFGCGILETDMYPVSLKLNFQDGHHILGSVGASVGNDGNVENHGKTVKNVGASDFQIPPGRTQTTIQFQLPSDSMTDEKIHSVAIDPVYEQFLFMKRDMNIVSSFYNEKIKELIFSGRKTVEDSTSSGFPMSQSDLFFMDPRVHAIIDEISELAIWVTKIPQVLDEISESDHNKTNQDDTRREEINGRVPCDFKDILLLYYLKDNYVI